MACLNGSMDLDERGRAQDEFAENVRILVSTDAGGEGLTACACRVGDESFANGCTRSSNAGIKTQTVLPSAETAAMLFWAVLPAGQITMRKVDGWQTLTCKLADEPVPTQIKRRHHANCANKALDF